MLSIVAFVLVGCGAAPDDQKNPPGAQDDSAVPMGGAHLASLRLSQGTITPTFRGGLQNYRVLERDLTEGMTTVTAEAGDPDAIVTIEHATIDGVVFESGPSPLEIAFGPSERVDITVTLDDETETYSVVSLPDTFPHIDVRVATDEAWDGYIFIGNVPSHFSDDGINPFAFILDRAGTPVWFRERESPALDFKVNPTGQLSYIGANEKTDDGLLGYVLDGSSYDIVRTMLPTVGEMDQREFKFLDNGDAILFATSLRQADLTKYGAPKDCCVVKEYTVQQIDPQGEVVFEWKGSEHLDELFPDTPERRIKSSEDGDDYAHINSFALDPSDGNWILSSRFTSHVLKIARYPTTFRGVTYEPGEIIWKLGGLNADWTIVGDVRNNGWSGFGLQHYASMPEPNHVMVYDNSSWDDMGPQGLGDSRYVEYELDEDTMTATKVNEYGIAGAGPTDLCGSAQRLPDGSTLIGWGDLSLSDPDAPSVTEVTADGTVVLELVLPEDEMSYRAGAGVWNAETGSWDAL